jgi:hypothetical protein
MCADEIIQALARAAILHGLTPEEITILTLPISEFGLCSCGLLVYPPMKVLSTQRLQSLQSTSSV